MNNFMNLLVNFSLNELQSIRLLMYCTIVEKSSTVRRFLR